MTSSVQGHAYLFRVYDTSSRIKCEILHDRSITSKDLLNDNHPISFIDNVNLHKLPPHCFGSLIAISQNPFSKSSNETSARLFKWEIAVIIHLDIRKTIICPCSFPDGDIKIHFQKMKEYHFFQCPFQIRYLNRITESSNASDDGFIESNINGPDIVLKKDKLPHDVYNHLKTKTKNIPHLVEINSPKYRERKLSRVCRNHPPSFMNVPSSSNGTKRKFKTTSQISSRTYHVNAIKNDHLNDEHLDGFLFPIISTQFRGEFAILSPQHAKQIISKGSLSSIEYSNYISSNTKRKICTQNIDVDVNGIVIEVTNCEESSGLQTESSIDSHLEPFERDGLLHAQWTFERDSFKVNDWDIFQELFHVVFGEFKFERSCSSCFGLNSYMGKKTSHYVRPSPRMSKESAFESEYYRQSWDVTFLPIVRKIVSSLVQTSTEYQRNTDRFFDLFQRQCYRSLLPTSRHGQFTFGSSVSRYSNLSILTFRNSRSSGFCNLPHIDNGDIWDTKVQGSASDHLSDLMDLSHGIDADNSFHSLLRHLRRLSISSVRYSYSNYTTCGYKTRFENEGLDRRYVACFVYLYLNMSVNIPPRETVYHTFGGAMGLHATSVPILIEKGNVYFNHASFSIFAWGGGQAPDVVKYIREKGGTVPRKRTNRNYVTEFYVASNEETRKEMRDLNYITEAEVEEINNRERDSTSNLASVRNTSTSVRTSKRSKKK